MPLSQSQTLLAKLKETKVLVADPQGFLILVLLKIFICGEELGCLSCNRILYILNLSVHDSYMNKFCLEKSFQLFKTWEALNTCNAQEACKFLLIKDGFIVLLLGSSKSSFKYCYSFVFFLDNIKLMGSLCSKILDTLMRSCNNISHSLNCFYHQLSSLLFLFV